MKEAIKRLLNEAKKLLEDKKENLRDNPTVISIRARKDDINETVAEKNPLIKEYINLYKAAEKYPNTYIGRMAKEVQNIAIEQEIYKVAISICDKDELKAELRDKLVQLGNDPAIEAYDKYLKGLEYLAGQTEEVEPEVRDFFRNELRVPLLEGNETYNLHRLGYDKYVETENKKLDARQAALIEEKAAYDKAKQELEEKEKQTGEQSPDRKALEAKAIALKAEEDSIANKRNDLSVFEDPEASEERREYHNVIAKTKAKELFSKQALGREVIMESFVGIQQPKTYEKPYADRWSPLTFCVAKMLSQKYTIEEIMDPKAHLDVKKAIGDEYLAHRENGDAEWYINEMFEGAHALMDAFKKYVKDHKEELKTEQDLTMHMGTLGILSITCFDMFQELLMRCKEYDKEFKIKTEAEYDNLADEVSSYHIGAATGGSVSIAYDDINFNAEHICDEIGRQLCTKMLLEEIQKDEPNLDNVLISIEEKGKMSRQLATMPEFKSVFGEESIISADDLSAEDFKQLAAMQSVEFVEKKNISYDRAQNPTKVTKEPETVCNNLNTGDNIDFVVSRGGKQLIATDIPVRTDNFLKNMEDKKFRGKESSNSNEFNNMMVVYDQTISNTGVGKTNAEKLEALRALKTAAAAYIDAKRAQKGYPTTGELNESVDNKMLGREKGGRSIFTTQGKDRYEFAVKLVTSITKLEVKYGKFEIEKGTDEIEFSEPNEINQVKPNESKHPEQEILELKEKEEIELRRK